MRAAPLHFRLLPAPPSGKTLRTYRRDAGWNLPLRADGGQDPRGRVQWVAVELEKQQIGIARLELAPPQFCYVADLIILSPFRRRGVGRWFLKSIEQYCGGQGIPRLLLEAAEGTQAYYARLGFSADPLLPAMLKKDVSPLLPKIFIPRADQGL